MKLKNCIFVLLMSMLLSSCTAAKLKKILEEGPDAYSAYVLIVPVGEEVKVWKETPEQFEDCFVDPPYTLKGYSNVYPVNDYFPDDSCMIAFKEAGLIEYDIKGEDEYSYVCDVYLTPKGRQHLLERYISDFENTMESAEFLVLAYSKIDNVSHVKVHIKEKEPHRKELYNCVSDIKLYATPFAECIGADVSRRALNKIHDVQEWEIRYNFAGANRYITDKLPKDDLDKDFICYDLNDYTKEEALKDYLSFCLSDTQAELKSELMSPIMGMAIQGYGEYYKWEDVPDEIQRLCVEKSESNIVGSYYCYFLTGTRKLGEVLRDKEVEEYVNIAGTGMGYMPYREFLYTIDVDCTKYGAAYYECDENTEWYGSILYVLYNNKIYFHRDAHHYWSPLKALVLNIDYANVQTSIDLRKPYKLKLTVPLEQAKHLL